MKVRLYTLEEANALVPQLEEMVSEARRLTDTVREAQAHVDDLRIVWGDALEEEDCPARGEYETRTADVQARQLRLELHLQKFKELGVELKGIDMGLVDFYSLNGDRLVFLCWRSGEKEIQAWHTLAGGFVGRKPIPEFITKGPES